MSVVAIQLSAELLLFAVPAAVTAITVRKRWTVLLLIVAAFVMGNGYGATAWMRADDLSALHGQSIILSGRVKEDPLSDAKQMRLQLDQLVVANRSVDGTVWVSTVLGRQIVRGDTVTFEGVLQPGFGTFAGVLYRASVTSVVRPVPGDVGRVVRDWFAAGVRQAIPEPQASLGMGFLTGQKSALPEDLSESLRIAGLTHIVVASGYNLTILVRLSRRLFVKHSKYLATVSTAAMILGFVAVTGLSPSMTRAGLVAGLSLLAWYYGRAFHPLVLLPFAAMLTVLAQPSYAWGDMGWQLSFAAFAGVMIVAPIFQRYFFGPDPPGTVRQILGETVAAQLVTLPIVVMAFGTISNVAIIANLLIVPFVPLAMLLTFVIGVVGLAMPAVVGLVGLPVTWLLTYMTSTATFLAELPWAQFEISPPVWLVVGYVLLLTGACWHMRRATGFTLREVNLLD